MPPKPSDGSQQLGAREQSVFKQLVRFYETKQYKKALKAADAILKKQATHGETLAMKGLVFNQLKRTDDAHSLVKRGLEANFNSHVCWHVYGLIYRSENKYEQAIKCFDERTQLLTFDGTRFAWRGLDDMLACHHSLHFHQHDQHHQHQRHQQRSHLQQHYQQRHASHQQLQLLVASYNPATEQLEYQPLSHPLLVKHGQHSMVDLVHSPTASTVTATAPADECNEVQLRVTSDHTLLVSLDGSSDPASGVSLGGSSNAETVRGRQHYTQFSRVEACQLLGLDESSAVRLLAAARKGANTSNLPRPRGITHTGQLLSRELATVHTRLRSCMPPCMLASSTTSPQRLRCALLLLCFSAPSVCCSLHCAYCWAV